MVEMSEQPRAEDFPALATAFRPELEAKDIRKKHPLS